MKRQSESEGIRFDVHKSVFRMASTEHNKKQDETLVHGQQKQMFVLYHQMCHVFWSSHPF